MTAIRPVQPGDGIHIARIMMNVGWFNWSGTLEDNAARIENRVRDLYRDDTYTSTWLAEVDGQTVGFICVQWLYSVTATEGYVSHLFIEDTARGKGIGAALLAHVETQAQSRGCVRLMLYIRQHREAYQRGFYAAQGWEEREDAALFMKRFDNRP